MSTYAHIINRLFTAKIADNAVIDSGTTFSGDAVDLPGSEKMAALLNPVAIFTCAITGSPTGGTFELQVQSEESPEWLPISGAAWQVASSDRTIRCEIGAPGAATKMRLYGSGLSGLNPNQDGYTVSLSVEGAVI